MLASTVICISGRNDVQHKCLWIIITIANLSKILQAIKMKTTISITYDNNKLKHDENCADCDPLVLHENTLLLSKTLCTALAGLQRQLLTWVGERKKCLLHHHYTNDKLVKDGAHDTGLLISGRLKNSNAITHCCGQVL